MAKIELVEKLCLIISQQADIIREQNELIEQSEIIEIETKDDLKNRIEILRKEEK